MKTAVVTGANRGIGLGLAQKLHGRGYQVIGTSRDLSDVRELAEVAHVLQLDVADDSSVEMFAKQISSVDVLINNAGWLDKPYPGSFAEQTIEDARKSFEVNTLGPLRVLQALSSSLNIGARVVNISSRLASLEDTRYMDGLGYCMSKVALNMLTRQVALDSTFKDRIIISINPGWVRTRMGGMDARLSTEESTSGIVEVIEGLRQEDSGEFFSWDGSRTPW